LSDGLSEKEKSLYLGARSMGFNIKKTLFLAYYRYSNTLTADSVVRKLKKQGIDRDQIRGKHLDFIYSNLRQLADAPDFSFAKEVVPGHGVNDSTESDPLWGVIVETREHPALEFVVNNFYANLGIPIQIFHGTENYDFIRSSSISDLISKGVVTLTPLDTKQLIASQYNVLFLYKEFWERVRGRKKILVFQTDAVSCKQSDFSIDEFMSYDYIGSKWPRKRPVGINIDGGNGGLSLRDWGKTITCLERFPPDLWVGGEDGYFAFHMDVMGAKIGREDACAKFSTQNEFLYNSFGAHKISSLEKNSREAFITYCPESKNIL